VKGLTDGYTQKVFRSDNYNYDFSKVTGYFKRWGKTTDDDPQWSPVGPEIADIEISKNGCPKIDGKNCRYCYKSNTSAPPENMSLDTFKIILSKLGRQLTQVAFGITGCRANPYFLEMMKHCRVEGVIPNFTLSGMDLDEEFLNQLPGLVGAVAVSYHGDAELCFKTVERLCSVGIKQVNIHAVTTDYDAIYKLVRGVEQQVLYNPNFNLNAIVFLSLKPKGRASKMTNMPEGDLARIVRLCTDLGIRVGFDSCSAHKAMRMFEPKFHDMIEPCESFGLFSCYINCEAKFFPCSFAEGIGDWKEGIDLLSVNNFMEEVWNGKLLSEYRKRSIECGRKCLLFSD
jgi:hypothetical protein